MNKISLVIIICLQFVFRIEEYPQELLRKSKDRFLEMIDFLQEQLK